MSDASEVYKLAADLSAVTAKAIPAMRGVMGEAGEALAKEWAANARETAGIHGKHYPDSIDSELAFSVTNIAVDVGPNSAKKQGGMGRGFEFGSVNQPPHLDGVRALDAVEPRVEGLVGDAIGRLLP